VFIKLNTIVSRNLCPNLVSGCSELDGMKQLEIISNLHNLGTLQK